MLKPYLLFALEVAGALYHPKEVRPKLAGVVAWVGKIRLKFHLLRVIQ
jgi:hypothetical protein